MIGFTIRKANTFQLCIGDTLRYLLDVTEEDIDSFLLTNNRANLRWSKNIIFKYDDAQILSIKALLFELKDMRACDELHKKAVLEGIDDSSLRILIQNRT